MKKVFVAATIALLTINLAPPIKAQGSGAPIGPCSYVEWGIAYDLYMNLSGDPLEQGLGEQYGGMTDTVLPGLGYDCSLHYHQEFMAFGQDFIYNHNGYTGGLISYYKLAWQWLGIFLNYHTNGYHSY